MSGNGDTPAELLRPPPFGRPIRLFDSAAGNLEGARIVVLDWSDGSCGRALTASLLRSSREEYENGRSRGRDSLSEGGDGVAAGLPNDVRFCCE